MNRILLEDFLIKKKKEKNWSSDGPTLVRVPFWSRCTIFVSQKVHSAEKTGFSEEERGWDNVMKGITKLSIAFKITASIKSLHLSIIRLNVQPSLCALKADSRSESRSPSAYRLRRAPPRSIRRRSPTKRSFRIFLYQITQRLIFFYTSAVTENCIFWIDYCFFFIILLTTFSIRPWRCFQITIRPLKPNSMLPESLRKERTFDLRPNQNDRLISEYLLWSWKWLFPFGAWRSSRSASSEKISMYLTRHLLPARIGSNACLAWLSHWD